MRFVFLSFMLACCLSGAIAQSKLYTDSTLKFDQRFTNCERKWVVISKKDTASHYLFGFIYVDEMAGFTFDLKGEFSVDKNGRYIVDTSMLKGTSMKYRIAPNWRSVALLSPSHFDELHIQLQPSWIKYYYSGNRDTSVLYNYRMGFVYNAAEDCKVALIYLKKAYRINPHYKGLEFEMAYAYNDLKHPDSAEIVLETALKYDPNNIMFYRELGFAYMNQNDFEKAISYYKQGIELYPDKHMPDESKAEIAFNLANIYKKSGKNDDYKEWILKAKGWSRPDSDIYKAVVNLGF